MLGSAVYKNNAVVVAGWTLGDRVLILLYPRKGYSLCCIRHPMNGGPCAHWAQ